MDDSSHTLVDWLNLIHEVAIIDLQDSSEQISGRGTTVEIDELKFGLRRYYRGRCVDVTWVFGGIERGSSQCFMGEVQEKSTETL